MTSIIPEPPEAEAAEEAEPRVLVEASPQLPAVAEATPDKPVPGTTADPGIRLACYALEAVLTVVTLGIGWLVWALATVADGQTPAKRILGLRVVDAKTGEPASFNRMFWARGVWAGAIAGPVALICTFGLALIVPLFDRQRRSLWEILSGTLVTHA